MNRRQTGRRRAAAITAGLASLSTTGAGGVAVLARHDTGTARVQNASSTTTTSTPSASVTPSATPATQAPTPAPTTSTATVAPTTAPATVTQPVTGGSVATSGGS